MKKNILLFSLSFLLVTACSNSNPSEITKFEEIKNQQGSTIGHRYNIASESIVTSIDKMITNNQVVTIHFTATIKKPIDTKLDTALLNDYTMSLGDYQVITTDGKSINRDEIQITTVKDKDFTATKQIHGTMSFNKKHIPKDNSLTLSIKSYKCEAKADVPVEIVDPAEIKLIFE